jgi:hypothetical protein
MMKVETCQLVAGNGRPIRKATKVVFPDGVEVRFMEKMSKRRAIEQAAEQRKRHPEYFAK